MTFPLECVVVALGWGEGDWLAIVDDDPAPVSISLTLLLSPERTKARGPCMCQKIFVFLPLAFLGFSTHVPIAMIIRYIGTCLLPCFFSAEEGGCCPLQFCTTNSQRLSLKQGISIFLSGTTHHPVIWSSSFSFPPRTTNHLNYNRIKPFCSVSFSPIYI